MIVTSMARRCAALTCILAPLCCKAEMASPAPFATIRLETTPWEEVFRGRLPKGNDEGGHGIVITAQFQKPESSGRSPHFSLCAALAARSKCLQFAVGDDGDSLKLLAVTESGNARVEVPVAFPYPIPMGQRLQVSMRIVDAHGLNFVVNGIEIESQALDFEPTEFKYACDALACDLTLANLVTPKPSAPAQTIDRAALDLYQHGFDALIQGEFEIAVRDLSKFIDKANFMSRPYAARAQAWLALKKNKEALSDLDEALRLDREMGNPDDPAFFLGDTRIEVEALRDRLQQEESIDGAAGSTPVSAVK